jgi:hypothetical protein
MPGQIGHGLTEFAIEVAEKQQSLLVQNREARVVNRADLRGIRRSQSRFIEAQDGRALPGWQARGRKQGALNENTETAYRACLDAPPSQSEQLLGQLVNHPLKALIHRNREP